MAGPCSCLRSVLVTQKQSHVSLGLLSGTYSSKECLSGSRRHS
jgi:hypothetical protein